MELLILLLLTPSVILAQRYHHSGNSGSASAGSNPNDEPFLPIYPLYPYSPKLMKRGTERELVAHLTPELYAPKIDARDSYTASFGANYQRDPYYPSYNPYPKSSSATSGLPNAYSSAAAAAAAGSATYPSTASYVAATSNAAYSSPNSGYATPNSSPYGAAYSGSSAAYTNPYPYSPAPYGLYNSYSTPYAGAPNPYAANPYASTAAYPNYNYQAPYYYPNYYNQPYPALPPPPPPPPHPSQSDSDESAEDSSSENDTSAKSSGGKKSESRKNKYKEDADSSSEVRDEQFVDGANFISAGSKDLDGQPSTYKTPSSYNQLEQVSDVHLRSVPAPGMPRTTYRVISVGGQPVGPDYPLPATYAKVQQLEQLMQQTLAKLLAQNAANQASQSQYQFQNNNQQVDSSADGNNFGNNKQRQTVIAKTGLAYVVNPPNLPKVGNNAPQFFNTYGARQNPALVIKVQDPAQSSTILSKAAGKYAESQFGQKSLPRTTVSLQQSQGIYIPPEAKSLKPDDGSAQAQSDYGDYDGAGAQNYDGPLAPGAGYKKNEQNYSLDQGQGAVNYHSSNLVTVQTPQSQSYQYSSYLPTQATQQQPHDYKTSLDDVNFSTKRNSKA